MASYEPYFVTKHSSFHSRLRLSFQSSVKRKKQGSEWNELPPQQRRCARDSRNCLSVAIWLQIREVLAAISNGPPVILVFMALFLLTQLKSVTSLMKPSTQWEVQAHHELAIDLVGTLWVRC